MDVINTEAQIFFMSHGAPPLTDPGDSENTDAFFTFLRHRID